MAIWRVDYDFLFENLEAQRARRGGSWRQVAAELGIPSGTFTRMKSGKGVADDTLVSLLNWLGAAESIQPFLVTDQTYLRPLDDADDADEPEADEPEATADDADETGEPEE